VVCPKEKRNAVGRQLRRPLHRFRDFDLAATFRAACTFFGQGLGLDFDFDSDEAFFALGFRTGIFRTFIFFFSGSGSSLGCSPPCGGSVRVSEPLLGSSSSGMTTATSEIPSPSSSLIKRTP
jgi:hypothetical protein